MFTQFAAHIDAIEFRHQDIEHHQRGLALCEALQRGSAVLGLAGCKSVLGQRKANDLADVGVVVDHQDIDHAAA